MSDFINNGWSVFIAAVTILGLVACLALLIVASKRKVMAQDNTTGHVWDGDLRELNNPLPRWWMILFVLTVVFAALYLALYPGLGNAAGKLGWTSTGQYDAEQAKAQASMAPLYAKFTSQGAESLAKDPQAMAIGERLFINNCAQCHGSDAKGSKGFPNLTLPVASRLATDSFDAVKATITNGRQGMMPPFGPALGADGVKDVANFVRSLSGLAHDSLRAQRGKEIFAQNCVACHGPEAKGTPALGAPNLTDKTWLYGSAEATIIETVTNGRTNRMPAFQEFLGEDKVHLLAAYVLSLSKNAAPAEEKK